MDKLTKERRSWNMSRIKCRDTKPELLVRSLLHKAGYRFRLHRNDLPGKPDIVLPKYRTVIFVHGCFWHRHPGCRIAYNPKTRVDFWEGKFRRNIQRHNDVVAELIKLGWNVKVIWECEISVITPQKLSKIFNKATVTEDIHNAGHSEYNSQN